MRLLPTAVAILNFLRVGHTAPTISCDSLTQKIPIENREQLLGKWMYVGEAVNIPGFKMLTKQYVEGAFVNVSTLPESDTLKFVQVQKSFGKCVSFSSNSLVANNTIHMTTPYKAIEVLLTTGCPDCMIIQGNFTFGSNYYQKLQLLSRRRILSTAELEEFKKQAECLNLPPPLIMDPEKGNSLMDGELCSEEQATSSTDITSIMNGDMGTQLIGLLDTVIKSQGGLTGFFDSILGNLPFAKQTDTN